MPPSAAILYQHQPTQHQMNEVQFRSRTKELFEEAETLNITKTIAMATIPEEISTKKPLSLNTTMSKTTKMSPNVTIKTT